MRMLLSSEHTLRELEKAGSISAVRCALRSSSYYDIIALIRFPQQMITSGYLMVDKLQASMLRGNVSRVAKAVLRRPEVRCW